MTELFDEDVLELESETIVYEEVSHGNDDYPSGLDVRRLTTLWLAVIQQAFCDSHIKRNRFLERAKHTQKSRVERNITLQAISWLNGVDSEGDFRKTCELAGLDPSYVRKKVKEGREKGILLKPIQ